MQYGFGLGTGTANTATWVNLTAANAVLPNRPIQDVAISPQNALVGYAAVGGFNENTKKTPGHVFQVTCTTFCNTFTWVNKTGNLPNVPVNSIANPNAPKQVFAGTDWGLFYTDDITATTPVWLHFQNGLPNTMVWDLSIDRGATTLALFTRSRGAWAIPLPTASATQVTLFSDDFEANKGWTTCPRVAAPGRRRRDANSPPTAWTTHPYRDNCNTDLTAPRSPFLPARTRSGSPSGRSTTRRTGRQRRRGCPCDYGHRAAVDRRRRVLREHRQPLPGSAPSYSQTTIPLPDTASGKTIKLRFHFHSDATRPFTRGAGGSTTPCHSRAG